jgi:hypothetical protein
MHSIDSLKNERTLAGQYLKRPFGGPDYVLHHLGRYTHRVAISNHRLVSFYRWPSDNAASKWT